MTISKSNGTGPVFLLGLGAQKSGTTWLHHYLAENVKFDSGMTKEYHIWDALDLPAMRHKKTNLTSLLWGGKHAERYRMQMDTNRYFDYFKGLLSDGAELTGDITPSYSGLSEDRLAFISAQFAQRGVATKAIILVRDPLSRIKSAVRYNLHKKNYNEGIDIGEKDFLSALRQYYTSEDCRLRTNYQNTIRNALSVFGISRTYIGVFETMFRPTEIERLSNFCNVPVRQQLGDVYVKKTEGSLTEDRQLDADIRFAFRETYAFCAELLPETKQLWQSNQLTGPAQNSSCA